MKLNSNIKPLPKFFSTIPTLKKYKGFLFMENIFFQSEIYVDLLAANPSPVNVGYLIHEQTHFNRMKEMGILNFGIKYLTRKGRFDEEFRAYKEQIKYLKSVGEVYNIERTARNLSNWTYLWCTDYKTAKRLLDKI